MFLWWCCAGVNIRPENSYLSVFCKIVVFVVVFLGGGRVGVFLCWCFWCFCGGGVVVVFCGVNIRPENSYFSVFCKIVVLSWCFGVFVVLFGVLQDCGHTWCFSRQLLADNLICSGPCFHIASVWLGLQPPRV